MATDSCLLSGALLIWKCNPGSTENNYKQSSGEMLLAPWQWITVRLYKIWENENSGKKNSYQVT